MAKQVLCLSEAGWRGMRRLSLTLDKLGIPCEVWINDCPPREIRKIVESKIFIRNYFFPRKVYGAALYLLTTLRASFFAAIVAEKKRTLAVLKRFEPFFKIPIYRLEEIDNGFRLFRDGKEIDDPERVFGGKIR